MSMEPFDYLSYKKNKMPNKHQAKEAVKAGKLKTMTVCVVTFFAILFPMLLFISSKSSKMDIEYGRLGNQQDSPYGHSDNTVSGEENSDDNNEDNTEDDVKPAKYTIDKRLFLIMQEEKAPSISRVLQKDKEQAEVISQEQFDRIKSNSSDVAGKKSETDKEETKYDTKEAENNQPPETTMPTATVLKPVIKPKIMPAPTTKPIVKYDMQTPLSKVLIGRYTTPDEAKEIQAKLSSVIQGRSPYIKRIGAHFSIQVGAYDNFETAKSIAARLQARGFEAWILQ